MCLLSRHSVQKEEADIDEAVQILKQAVQKAPGNATYLQRLGLVLAERYLSLGHWSDLDESIELQRRAIGRFRNRLGSTSAHYVLQGGLLLRHAKTGSIADPEKAIQTARQSLDMFRESPELRISLAEILHSQYLKTKNVAHLREAIQLCSQAIHLTTRITLRSALTGRDELTRRDVFTQAKWLLALTEYLHSLFNCTGSLADFDECVQVARQAVRLLRQEVDSAPSHGHSLADPLSDFTYYLVQWYDKAEEPADLVEAIQLA
ncbi:hypothetical protein ACHAQJ_008530 [Trichoderma viride]